ncbi:ribosomal RNA large subunit methyltransferase E isoform X2 [Rosa chinensis]|uniref:ribosomal RNA large subunit methyltransferase E isoform X2 n=1 Tax=Rosa chinensis TaxID=74649 RepID=UPI000D094D89|nr:ribosomal RNA large subunit methyltransferase E isoform X2 [Rosa chinensis]
MSGAGKPDFFYREAQRLGYVARSAFKVACQSLGPIKNGGLVVGIDLKKVKVPAMHCDSRVQTLCADVMKLPKTSVRELSPQKGFSVILSDMCPLVSGIASKDAALSLELGMQALDLAVGEAALANPNNVTQVEESLVGATTSSDVNGVLKRGGHLVIKLLESEDVQDFNRICKPLFRKASLLRPKATRSSSREIYLICQGLQSQART